MTSVASVIQLLETQKKALTSGDFSGLDDLQKRLQTAADRLSTARLSVADLQRVRHAAQRNTELLAAARKGLEQAQITTQQRNQPELTTYTTDGRQTAPKGATGRTLSRR